jgi:polyisoprenoid-binding protein YceI
MKYLSILLITFGLFSTSSAQTYFSETGTANFTSSVPLHTFTGTSEHLTGMIKLDENTVDFFLDLETLDTGNAKRDKDMLITLETDEYQFAEFFGKLDSEFDPESTEIQPVTVIGDFTIHGQTNEVEIEGTLQMTDEGLLVKASWVLLLDDYDIEPPRLLIIKVDEEQKIEIEALLKPYEEDEQ